MESENTSNEEEPTQLSLFEDLTVEPLKFLEYISPELTPLLKSYNEIIPISPSGPAEPYRKHLTTAMINFRGKDVKDFTVKIRPSNIFGLRIYGIKRKT